MKSEMVDQILVLVPGETQIDAANAPRVKEELLNRIPPDTKVIVDLSYVTFIDSSGLGALLSALRKSTAQRGDLKLAGVQQPVRAILELVRFHRVMDIFNTREEALRSYRGA